MATLTKSVRLLEDFFQANPEWYTALFNSRYRALHDVTCNPDLWLDIFIFRFGYVPSSTNAASWDTLLFSERMLVALRVFERRWEKL